MTTERFNEIADLIAENTGWKGPLIADIRQYYEKNPTGGSLHVVLDDGNVEERFVAFCQGYAAGRDDIEGNHIANLLLFLTENQRQALYNALWGRK